MPSSPSSRGATPSSLEIRRSTRCSIRGSASGWLTSSTAPKASLGPMAATWRTGGTSGEAPISRPKGLSCTWASISTRRGAPGSPWSRIRWSCWWTRTPTSTGGGGPRVFLKPAGAPGAPLVQIFAHLQAVRVQPGDRFGARRGVRRGRRPAAKRQLASASPHSGHPRTLLPGDPAASLQRVGRLRQRRRSVHVAPRVSQSVAPLSRLAFAGGEGTIEPCIGSFPDAPVSARCCWAFSSRVPSGRSPRAGRTGRLR